MQDFAEQPELDKAGNYFFFTQQQASTLIRSGAWNLELTIKKENVVDFVVIATEGKTFVKDGNGLLSQSLLYPNKGGAFFWNGSQDEASIGKYFTGQLNKILGFSSQNFCSNGSVSSIELDRIKHGLLLENLHKIANAQTALNELLAKSPFIEIDRNLSHILHQWSISATELQNFLKMRDLQRAYEESAKTAELAESAFYHPTLMGKMYFPDEHKFAVYMPVLVSLLPSTFALLKIIVSKVTGKVI